MIFGIRLYPQKIFLRTVLRIKKFLFFILYRVPYLYLDINKLSFRIHPLDTIYHPE